MEGIELAIGVAFVLLGGWLFERHALPRYRPGIWFALGFPLGARLVPIQTPPEGAGQTPLVRWEVRGDHVVFWSVPQARRTPGGLHGRIDLVRGRGGRIDLVVRWSPPLSAAGAVCWLALLGVLRGDGPVAVGVASLLAVAIGLVYRHAALRAAAELRFAFVRGD